MAMSADERRELALRVAEMVAKTERATERLGSVGRAVVGAAEQPTSAPDRARRCITSCPDRPAAGPGGRSSRPVGSLGE
jgi:hypothetical protein